jgi:hypothetical protein
MKAEIIAQGREAVAAYILERQAASPGIAREIPRLIACEWIRDMTHGVDAVPAADILTVLDGAELAEWMQS